MTDEALFDAAPTMRKAARLSDDGRYRYALVRRWANDGPLVTFIMLNPSTADAELDDPTIRRCIGFARSWGAVALHVLNLYALRSTDPRTLWTSDDPVGPENDRYLLRHSVASGGSAGGHTLVAAWGANARPDRVDHVLAMPGMFALKCLGRTKAGAPKHPLYLPADTPLQDYFA